MSFNEAFRTNSQYYTTGDTYAEFAEEQKKTLEPGMLADFVVLDRDLIHRAPA